MLNCCKRTIYAIGKQIIVFLAVCFGRETLFSRKSLKTNDITCFPFSQKWNMEKQITEIGEQIIAFLAAWFGRRTLFSCKSLKTHHITCSPFSES